MYHALLPDKAIYVWPEFILYTIKFSGHLHATKINDNFCWVWHSLITGFCHIMTWNELIAAVPNFFVLIVKISCFA